MEEFILVVPPILEGCAIGAFENMGRLYFRRVMSLHLRDVHFSHLIVLLILRLLGDLCFRNKKVIAIKLHIKTRINFFVLNLIIDKLIVRDEVMEIVARFFAILSVRTFTSMAITRITGTKLQKVGHQINVLSIQVF